MHSGCGVCPPPPITPHPSPPSHTPPPTRCVPPPTHTPLQVFTDFDQDGNGVISGPELLDLLAGPRGTRGWSELDGCLAAAAAAATAGGYGGYGGYGGGGGGGSVLVADTLPAVLRHADANGDGQLSLEEFVALLQVGGLRREGGWAGWGDSRSEWGGDVSCTCVGGVWGALVGGLEGRGLPVSRDVSWLLQECVPQLLAPWSTPQTALCAVCCAALCAADR